MKKSGTFAPPIVIELPPKRVGHGGAASATTVAPARFVPYSDARLPGARILPPVGYAEFTNACEDVAGAGPMLKFTEFDPPAPGDGFNTSIVPRPTRAISRALI